MSKELTISAVMFVYNEELYIQEMIDSLLGQTTKLAEIIIVDDFSTDSTRNIIIKNSKRHPIIKYNLNDKKGKVHAYIKGLTLVSSPYFFICAGDDVLEKTYVERNIAYLKEKNIDYVLNNFFTCDENLNILSESVKKPSYSCKELVYKNHAGGYIFGKRSILEIILPMREDLPFEDWFNNIKLAFLSGELHVNPTPLFYYRRHGNASTTNNSRSREKYLFLVRRDIRLFEIVLEEKFIDDALIQNLVKARIRYLQAMDTLSGRALFAAFSDKHISLKEKLRLLLFPLYFNMVYK